MNSYIKLTIFTGIDSEKFKQLIKTEMEIAIDDEEVYLNVQKGRFYCFSCSIFFHHA